MAGNQLVPVNLKDLDTGKALRAVNHYLKAVAQDCIDRNRIEAVREITLKIKVKPEYDHGSDTGEVAIEWETSWKVPGRKGSISKAAVIDGEAQINPYDGDDPFQMHFDDPALSEIKDEPENVTQFNKQAQ